MDGRWDALEVAAVWFGEGNVGQCSVAVGRMGGGQVVGDAAQHCL